MTMDESHDVKLTHYVRASNGYSSHNGCLEEAKCTISIGTSEIAIREREAAETFQVVWTQLAFKVTTSTYDRILRKSFSRFRAIFKLASSCRNDSQLDHGEFSGERTIFENLNGYIKSGELTAILGPSGAGKTSLLNAICGHTHNYRGQIKLVGGTAGRHMRLTIIPQKDYLVENLSVHENLSYAARILNPEASTREHEKNIERVVKMLNLSACLYSSTANISGGEHKRVSVAQELLRQPDILVLDEPTSGLDSLNCKRLIGSLGELIRASSSSARPLAIVMTIHQPDVELFHMFDHVYCMARGGRVIFDGHPRDALTTVKVHAGIFTGDTPPVNPANLLIDIASGDLYGQEPIERLAQVQRAQMARSSCCDFPRAVSSLTLASAASLPSLAASQLELFNDKEKKLPYQSSSKKHQDRLVRDKRLAPKFKSNQSEGYFWHRTCVLAQRAFKSTLRDPLLTLVTLIFHLAIPLGVWTVYTSRVATTNACPVVQRDLDLVSLASNATVEKLEDLHEQVMSALECSMMLFLVTYSFSFCSLTVSSLAFPLNMHVLLKEVRNGWYSLPAYVLAKSFANILFEVAFPVMSIIMIYLMLDMPSSAYEWRMCALALMMALIAMISHTQGLIFGALCMDSAQTAIFLACASTLPQALLSGLAARVRFMPERVQALSWLSQYRYSNDLSGIIRFGYGMCPCDANSTGKYLRTSTPEFSDVPRQLRSVLVSSLMQKAFIDKEEGRLDIGESNLTTADNLTAQVLDSLGDTNEDLHYLTLDAGERYSLLERMDLGEVDMFANIAGMVSRAFAFGRKLEDCSSVRSQILRQSDAPPDDLLPLIFAGMFAYLIVCKLILFVTVKYKIGNRL